MTIEEFRKLILAKRAEEKKAAEDLNILMDEAMRAEGLRGLGADFIVTDEASPIPTDPIPTETILPTDRLRRAQTETSAGVRFADKLVVMHDDGRVTVDGDHVATMTIDVDTGSPSVVPVRADDEIVVMRANAFAVVCALAHGLDKTEQVAVRDMLVGVVGLPEGVVERKESDRMIRLSYERGLELGARLADEDGDKPGAAGVAGSAAAMGAGGSATRGKGMASPDFWTKRVQAIIPGRWTAYAFHGKWVNPNHLSGFEDGTPLVVGWKNRDDQKRCVLLVKKRGALSCVGKTASVVKDTLIVSAWEKDDPERGHVWVRSPTGGRAGWSKVADWIGGMPELAGLEPDNVYAPAFIGLAYWSRMGWLPGGARMMPLSGAALTGSGDWVGDVSDAELPEPGSTR